MKGIFFKVFVPSLRNSFIWLNAFVLLLGVFYFGWNSEVVVIAYFLETIIIGFIHVCKMLMVYFYGNEQKNDVPPSPNEITGFAAIPFFIVHYFFFIFVQSVFMFAMLQTLIPSKNNAFDVFGNYAYVLSQHDILMAFLSLAFTNVAVTLKNFVLPGVYKTTTVSKLLFQPYLRIIIQQFVTILATFFIMIVGGSIIVALLIIGFRLVTDLLIVAASDDVAFRRQLISITSKNKSPEDAKNTEESINSFLEK